MAKNLVIVESPAKAKTIKKFLGRSYKVEASMGHLRDLPKSKLGVDVENDFEPKYIKIRGKAKLINALKKEADKSENVYLATDPDREGEAISWHLAFLLGLDDKKNIRITFNEITKNAVKNSIKKARTIDKDLVDAQQARRILDRIVGYKISPILWKKVKKGLSAGRVQSVALRLICEKEKEIDNFVPKEYWSIDAFLKNKNGEFKASFYGNEKGKIELENEEQTKKIIEKIKDEDFVIEDIKKRKTKRKSSPPFTTSTLQQEASKKLGYSTKKTMMLAQQLYEGINIEGHGTNGLITYLRTDSTRVSSEATNAAKEYILSEYGEEYYKSKGKYKKKASSQDAHEAIRPTHIDFVPKEIKKALKRDQYRLYKLIWERFIASQMKDAIYDSKTLTIKVDGYKFRANGRTLVFKGFKALYSESNVDSEGNILEEKDDILPEVEINEKLNLNKLLDEQHFTRPPARYTEASLVKELESNGIGRPSTYSPTISTILSRGYVVRERKLLIPTELGNIVNNILVEHFSQIVKVEFTANVEAEFDEVEKGSKTWKEVLREFYEPFEKVLKTAEENIKDVEVPQIETDVICEKCGKNMVLKIGRYGKFLACPGFPDCRNTKPYIEKAGIKCPKCKDGDVIIRRTKKGRIYYGCSNYPDCDYISWNKPTGEKCPECDEGFLVERERNDSKKITCTNKKCNFTQVRKIEKDK